MPDSFITASAAILASPIVIEAAKRTLKFISRFSEPEHVVRMAQAEREAAIIRAQSEIEVTDLQQRAVERWAMEQERHQWNLEKINHGALLNLQPDAKPDQVADDWLENVFDKCRHVSDREMQSLWSKIIASEFNQPGSFSRKTVNMMVDIGSEDARTFARLCRFQCTVFGETHPMVIGRDQSIYLAEGILSDDLKVLTELGLIEATDGTWTENVQGRSFTVHYFNRSISTGYLPGQEIVMLGRVRYTRAGREISRIIPLTELPEFFEWLKTIMRPQGFFII